MIYSIRGRLGPLEDNHVVIEDSNGISWEMEISLRTRNSIQSLLGEHPDDSSEVYLYTFLYHREDQMTLFGFSSLEEKQTFLLLNKVNGVGPRQSMKILSAAGPSQLATAITTEDESFLTSLPGIGAKGAKKIILSLKDQVQKVLAEDSHLHGESESGMSDSSHSMEDQLSTALIDMGFDRKASRETVKKVLRREPDLEQGEALRRSIIELS